MCPSGHVAPKRGARGQITACSSDEKTIYCMSFFVRGSSLLGRSFSGNLPFALLFNNIVREAKVVLVII